MVSSEPHPKSPASSLTGLLAWAGLIVHPPAHWRMVRAAGQAEKGYLVLADDDRVRLQLQWTPAPRRLGNTERLVHRRLKALKLIQGRPRPSLQRLLLPNLGELFIHTVECPAIVYSFVVTPVGRVLEMLYHPGEEREDDLYLRSILPSIEDQPIDVPQRWAFYGTSFVVPGGFRYRSAVLNLGDCRVMCVAGKRELFGRLLTVRHVYPAGLALARQPLEGWQRQWIEPMTYNYNVAHTRPMGRGDPVMHPVVTPRGPGLMCTARLKPPLGLLYRKAPRDARIWTVHDAAADRLIGIHLACEADQIEPLFQEVLGGLHWHQSHGPA